MEEWVRCPKCGHKLFRILRPCGAESVPSIEIKCSSCKAIVNLNSAFTGIPTPTVYERQREELAKIVLEHEE